jgi:hypothetical protein
MKFLLWLVLLAAVGGGVYYWQQMEVKDLDKKLADANSQVTRLSGQVSDLQKQLTDSKKTEGQSLTVKEWGVKIPVDDSVKGLSYTIKGTTGSFRTTELNTLSGNCTTNSVNVARGKAQEKLPNEQGTQTGDTFEKAYAAQQQFLNDNQTTARDIAVKIGEYYYVPPGYSGASCAAADKTSQDKEAAALVNIAKAVNKMVVAN